MEKPVLHYHLGKKKRDPYEKVVDAESTGGLSRRRTQSTVVYNRAKVVPGRTQRDNTWFLAFEKVTISKVFSVTTFFSKKYLSHNFDDAG